MLHDVFPLHDLQVDEGASQMGVEAEVVHEDQQGPIEGRVKKFYDLLKNVDKLLYEGCTKHSKFTT